MAEELIFRLIFNSQNLSSNQANTGKHISKKQYILHDRDKRPSKQRWAWYKVWTWKVNYQMIHKKHYFDSRYPTYKVKKKKLFLKNP